MATVSALPRCRPEVLRTQAAALRAVLLVAVLYAIAAASPVASPAAGTAYTGDPVLRANRAVGLYGDPVGAAAYWHKQEGSDCGQVAVADVVGELTGNQPPEHQINAVARGIPSSAGSGTIWQPRGFTNIRDLPILLWHYGIRSNAVQTNLEVVKRMLEAGRKVIAIVNAETIWDRPGRRDRGDHFVVVTGIDSRSGIVHLNDSGISSGRDERISLATFERAWAPNYHSAVLTR